MNEKVTPETLRASLQDVLQCLNTMAPYCETVKELIDLVELALINDGQLKLIMKPILSGKK